MFTLTLRIQVFISRPVAQVNAVGRREVNGNNIQNNLFSPYKESSLVKNSHCGALIEYEG
jgi:hypothetical protein